MSQTPQAVLDTGGGDYEESLYCNDRVAQYVLTAEDVGSQDVEDYTERGYLALKQLLSPHRASQALDALADLAVDP